MDIETKITLDADLAKAQKELKDTLADLDIAKKERIAMESIQARNIKLIDEQNNELKTIINDIANQKLSWLHEKDEQMKEIDDKKSEVEAVLARSVELDKKELEIKALHEEVKAVRNENNTILLATKDKEKEIDVKVNYAERKVIEAQEKEAMIDKKIVNFKDQVEKVIKELIKI